VVGTKSISISPKLTISDLSFTPLEAIAGEREGGRIDLRVYREGKEREISQGKRGSFIEGDEMDILVIMGNSDY